MDWILQHYIEIFGAVSGVIYVFLEIRQNIWLWPLGIITSGLYTWIFYNSGFYADMGLQWYYLFISIYGWILWSRGKAESSKVLKISRISLRTALVLLSISMALFVGIWFVLEKYTDSTIPAWDAFTTSLSIVATWMLAHKIIEHWYIWILVNIVSIGLYIYKGLYPTVVLFIVYTIMAFVGYIEWKKEIRMICIKERV